MYGILAIGLQREDNDMGVPVSDDNNNRFGICWEKFVSYLMKQIVTIFLAPALAFGIAVLVEALKNLSMLDVRAIFENCIYGDILLSVLSVYVILFWEYIVVYKSDAETYLKSIQCLVKPLKGLGFILFFALLAVAVVFRFYENVDSGTAVLFNVVEGLGISVCIILQCVSHPKEYMTPRSKH